MTHLIKVGNQYQDDQNRLFNVKTHPTPQGNVGYVFIDGVCTAVVLPSGWDQESDITWPPE